MKAYMPFVALIVLSLCSCVKHPMGGVLSSDRETSLGTSLLLLNPDEPDGRKVWMSQYETTRREFNAFLQATAHDPSNVLSIGPSTNANYPIENISFYDANAFCGWLTQRDRDKGLIKASEYYSLPSDLEWSLAVGVKNENTSTTPEIRAKDESAETNEYTWGKQWPPPPDVGNLSRRGDYAEPALPVGRAAIGTINPVEAISDGFADAAPVGHYKPSEPLKFYDLTGNVWEMTDTVYSATAPGNLEIALRGGSYVTSVPAECKKNFRAHQTKDAKQVGVGFRIVLRAVQ